MSSDVQSTLELIQLHNYVSIVIITAVVYDYLLMFSSEIDYVWCKRWTWVSAIFVLVRYVGLSCAILSGLVRSTFIPGPLTDRLYVSTFRSKTVDNGRIGENGHLKGTMIYLGSVWEWPILLNATDLIMILRLYAIWSRSKRILCVLLLIYVPQLIFSFVFTGIYNDPSAHIMVTIIQFTDVSFCDISSGGVPWRLRVAAGIAPFVLSVTLMVLVVVKALGRLFEVSRTTKRWQPDRYTRLFVRDGVLYFFANVLLHVIAILRNATTSNSVLLLFLSSLSFVITLPMMPRYIIDVRELYDCELRRRQLGIDSAFGIGQTLTVSGDTTVSSIAFADSGPMDQDLIVEVDMDRSEVIQLELLR